MNLSEIKLLPCDNPPSNGKHSEKKKKRKDRESDAAVPDGVAEEAAGEVEALGVAVSGNNIKDANYATLSSFAATGLPAEVMDCCKKFSKPSPIQAQSWPFLLDGRDLIGIAATGSAQEFMDPNPVKVVVGSEDLAANHDVMQIVEVLDDWSRDARLVSLLEKYHQSQRNKFLVFVLYKKEAACVENMLQRRGWKAVSVHGHKSQKDQTNALHLFKEAKCPLMASESKPFKEITADAPKSTKITFDDSD